ncbi:MAG: ABC transporter ATP-binding protein [Lachnospiraceae bacterium]|jgi:ABC-2 type transport system ATP-binding protein|nr:ABC transporter ATP-binding protein [Lachnospiraceae bacterium]
MNAIQYKNVKKNIESKEIIKDVSLEIKTGEVFGLLGPNGAGKTTLMKMTLGLSSISDGEITIFGHSIQKDTKKAVSQIGSLIETPALYPYLTAYDNLKIFANLVHAPKSRIKEVSNLVSLDYALNQKVKGFSLGMKQRLGIAIALLRNPKILILDEPTNGLDPQGVLDLRTYLKKLAKELDIAVIVSSHMLPEMDLLCDRFAIIKSGCIRRVMTIDESHELQGNNEIQFEVDDPNIAAIALSGYKYVIENKRIVLSITREIIPIITEKLVAAKIPIYSITSKDNQLEHFYFQVVNEE